MAQHVNSQRRRSGKVTARALRFGLHPGESIEREADVLATLAGNDLAVISAARHRILGPRTAQPELDLAEHRREVSMGSVHIDKVRRHALDVLERAEHNLRGRTAA